MTGVYGDSSPACSTVAKWEGEFKRGRSSLEDNPRSGRPADVITKEMVASVETLIMNDRRIKIDYIASECKISHGSVSTIIHEHLEMSKVSARWDPETSMYRITSKDCSQVERCSACMRNIQRAFMHV